MKSFDDVIVNKRIDLFVDDQGNNGIQSKIRKIAINGSRRNIFRLKGPAEERGRRDTV